MWNVSRTTRIKNRLALYGYRASDRCAVAKVHYWTTTGCEPQIRPELENGSTTLERKQYCGKPRGKVIKMRILKKLVWKEEHGTTQPSGKEFPAIGMQALQQCITATNQSQRGT